MRSGGVAHSSPNGSSAEPGAGGVVVMADRLDDRVRQAPRPGQLRAELGVADAQVLLLPRAALAAAQELLAGPDRAVGLGEVQVQDDRAQVAEQGGDEVVLRR